MKSTRMLLSAAAVGGLAVLAVDAQTSADAQQTVAGAYAKVGNQAA